MGLLRLSPALEDVGILRPGGRALDADRRLRQGGILGKDQGRPLAIFDDGRGVALDPAHRAQDGGEDVRVTGVLGARGGA